MASRKNQEGSVGGGSKSMMTFSELREDINRNLDKLPKREAEVIIMHYGLDGNEPMTLEEIGKRYGVTRERIRQVKAKAIRRLKSFE